MNGKRKSRKEGGRRSLRFCRLDCISKRGQSHSRFVTMKYFLVQLTNVTWSALQIPRQNLFIKKLLWSEKMVSNNVMQVFVRKVNDKDQMMRNLEPSTDFCDCWKFKKSICPKLSPNIQSVHVVPTSICCFICFRFIPARLWNHVLQGV